MANYKTNMQIRASLDSTGVKKGVDKVNKQLGTLASGISKAERSFIRMAQRLSSIYIIAQTVKTAMRAISYPVKEGFEFNKVLDEQVTALTALTVATSQDIDSLGNRITLTEKYTMAQQESLETMEKLKVINQTTPHNLAETAKIYKTIYAQSKSTGSSIEEMITATQSLSLASKAGGIDLTTLLKSVDSLGTGTYLANSEFGKFAEALGVSREKMKALAKEGDGKALKYFLEQVEQLNVKTDAWAVHTAQADNAWNNLVGNMSVPIFKTAKTTLDEITESLQAIIDDKDIMDSLTKGYSSFISGIVNGLLTFASGALKVYSGFILPMVKNLKLTFVEIEISQKNLISSVSSSITWLFETIGGGLTKAWDWVAKKIKEAETQAINNQHRIQGFIPKGDKVLNAYKQQTKEDKEIQKAQDAISERIDKSIANAQKISGLADNIKKVFNSSLEKNLSENGKELGEGGDSTLIAKKKQEEATAVEIAKILKAKKAVLKNFEDAYKQSTMTQYNYERDKLEQEYQLFKANGANKTRLSEFYNTELQKIKAEELKDFQEKEAEKLKASTNFAQGAIDALNKYAEEAKPTYEKIGSIVESAMKGMEDALVDFVKTGKLNFSDLADSIISDIARMMIQQNITSPIATALGGINWGSMFGFAKGGAFNNGVQMFASGGVVNSPTAFSHSGGLGVMGEAGSEAIMPLQRIGGDMGVRSTPSKVVLNITNNSGQDISAEQVSEMTRSNQKGEEERVISIVMDSVSRNKNGMRDMLKGL